MRWRHCLVISRHPYFQERLSNPHCHCLDPCRSLGLRNTPKTPPTYTISPAALYTATVRYIKFPIPMSKFGVLVMGPAGAGKVCASLSSLRSNNHIDNFLLGFDPTSSKQQAAMLLHKLGSSCRGFCIRARSGYQRAGFIRRRHGRNGFGPKWRTDLLF